MKRMLAVGTLILAMIACSDSATAPVVVPSASLTVKGSASANAAAGNLLKMGLLFDTGNGAPVGNPSEVDIGLYAMYISPNADCSAPVLVSDNGAVASIKDFTQTPTLFTGSPANGTYKCVMFKMSDVVGFKSATGSASCVVGTKYFIDIYRAGQSGFLDINKQPITATGTDSMPADDHVLILATTDTAAAKAAGFGQGQVIPLVAPLVVPGNGTFFWDGTNEVVDAGTGYGCGLNPPKLSFK